MARADASIEVAIRQADGADVNSLAAIEQAVFSDPWPASAFHDLLQQSHANVNVAVDRQNVVCGYCILLIGADEGEIANIAVAPSRQRQGVASLLLDVALNFARSHGVTSIYLEVRLSNEPAKTLYESRGFEPVGRRRAYYREPLEDALVLRWQPAHHLLQSSTPGGARKRPTGR